MINCKHFICFSNKKTKFSEILYEISWLLHKFSVSLQANYNKWARKSPFKQGNKRKKDMKHPLRSSVCTEGRRMAQDKKTPIVLFDGDDASMNFNFYNKEGAIQTKDYFFEVANKTDSSVVMRLAADSASYIDFIYTLKPDSYLMNFEIKAYERTLLCQKIR